MTSATKTTYASYVAAVADDTRQLKQVFDYAKFFEKFKNFKIRSRDQDHGSVKRKMEPQRVADFLIREGFLLTALELHIELSEKGKGLPSLTTFFKDPSNFEAFTRTQSSPMSSVCGSQMTLDDVSLFDVTRYSEDSHLHTTSDDRVAVLEFELRKARETIEKLREELTMQTKTPRGSVAGCGAGSSRTNSGAGLPDSKSEDNATLDEVDEEDDNGIKAHEQRIVNFLVNEYLLQYGYKLTAITFSDENDDADYFEDWDNVGINVAKPPNLLRLFRDYGKHVVKQEKDFQDFAMQCDEDVEASDLKSKLVDQQNTIANLESSNANLTVKIEDFAKSNEYLELQVKEKESLISTMNATNHESSNKNLTKDDNENNSDKKVENIESVPDFQCIEDEPAFTKMMYGKCCPRVEQNDVQEQDQVFARTDDAAIRTLAECLPNIVPNILLNKREELLPLLMITIQCHEDPKVRDQLLSLLFNLNKKPDEEQRRVILRGFRKIAKAFGPEKLEAEILPQIWEQIDHKYPERRLLVAEATSVLMPYIPDSLRSSLVMSMLQQLAIEDKEVEVRVKAVEGLGLMVLHLSDETKIDAVIEMFSTLSKDQDEAVLSAVQTTLLPALAKTLVDRDGLLKKLAAVISKDFEQHCGLLSETSNYSKSLVLMAQEKLKTVLALLPYVISAVIKSFPSIHLDDYQNQNDNQESRLREPDFLTKTELVGLIVNVNSANKIMDDLRSYLSREWYESWSALDFIKNDFTDTIIASITSIVASDLSKPLLADFNNLFAEIRFYLGDQFVRQILVPKFKMALSAYSTKEEDAAFSPEEVKKFESLLLPTYTVGLLATVDPQSGDIMDALNESTILHCENDWNKAPLIYSVQGLLDIQTEVNFRDAIAELAWALLVHQNPKVKCLAGTILQQLATSSSSAAEVVESDDDLIGPKILPGLVTLSSDPDPSVRISAMQGLAHVVLSVRSTAETREKAAFQLVAFLDQDHERNVEVLVSAIEAVGIAISKDHCPHKLRDDLFLPKLADVVLSGR